MPDEFYAFQVSTPAGTAIAAPQTVALSMPVRVVRHVTLVVPPGPHGLAGWRVAANGTQILPVKSGSWIVADNDKLDFDVLDWIESGSFQLISYNVGDYAHQVEVRFQVDLPQRRSTPQAFQPLTF